MGGRDKGLTEGSTAKNYLLVIHWRRKWQPTLVFLPEQPMDRGAWQATVHGVTKEQDMP